MGSWFRPITLISVFAILLTKYNLGGLIYALRLLWSILLA